MIKRDEYLKFSKDTNNEIINNILQILNSTNLNRSMRSKLNQMLNDISNLNPSDSKEGFECDNAIKDKVKNIGVLVSSDKIVSAGQVADELMDSREYNNRLTMYNPSISLPLTKDEIKSMRKKEAAEKKLSKKQIEDKTIELLISEAVDEQKKLIKTIAELQQDIEEAQDNEDVAMINYLNTRIAKVNMMLQAATNISNLRSNADSQQFMIKIANDFLAEKQRMDKRKNAMLNKEDFTLLMNKYAQAMEESRAEDPNIQAGMSALFGGTNPQMMNPQMSMPQFNPQQQVVQPQQPQFVQPQQAQFVQPTVMPQVNQGPVSQKKIEKALEDVEDRIHEIDSDLNKLENQRDLIGQNIAKLLEQRKTITPGQAIVLDSKINDLKSKYNYCKKAIERKVSEKNELNARKAIAQENLGQMQDEKEGLKINSVLSNENIANMAENINQRIVERNNNIAELDVAASIANSERYNTQVNSSNLFESDTAGAEFDPHAFDDLMKELGVEPLPMEENNN